MQTKVSTKGQVVLPGPLRRRLGIRAGDPLEANIEAGSIGQQQVAGSHVPGRAGVRTGRRGLMEFR